MKWLFGFVFGTILLRTVLPIILIIAGVIYFQSHTPQVMSWVHAAQHGLADGWNWIMNFNG